jgi:hypothetical protein
MPLFTNVLEVEFSELPLNGVLGSSATFQAWLQWARTPRWGAWGTEEELYVVGTKTSAHRVLRLNLRALVGPLAPPRRPSGHHPRRPRLCLGPPRVCRPILTGDLSYGHRLGRGVTTQAPRSAPDLARRSPLVSGGSARTCRPRRRHSCLQCPAGRPCHWYQCAPTCGCDHAGLPHLPRQRAGRGDRVAGVRPAPTAGQEEFS